MRCTSCGNEFAGSFGNPCPACGVIAQDPFAPTPATPPGPTPWQTPTSPNVEPSPVAGDGIPWEVEQSAGSLFETIKVVLLETTSTFQRAGVIKSIGPSFLFAMILGVVGGFLSQLWQLALNGQWLMNFVPAEYHDALDGAFSVGVTDIIAIPIGVAIGLFVSAGIQHVALMMVGGANNGFESTFRVVAYANGAVALFPIIPGIGHIAQFVFLLVVSVIGYREIHQTTTGKALFGALFPLVLCCFCIGIIGAIAAATVGSIAGFGN